MKDVQKVEEQRILGRTVGRTMSAEEVAAVAGAYDINNIPEGMTMPIWVGNRYVYGDME